MSQGATSGEVLLVTTTSDRRRDLLRNLRAAAVTSDASRNEREVPGPDRLWAGRIG